MFCLTLQKVQILLEIRIYPMILKTSETVLGSWMCMITLIMVHFSHGIIIKWIIHWQGSLIQHSHVALVEFVSPHVSDHCPILINLNSLEFSPPKPLKFFICLTKHPNFLTIVEDSWNEDVVVDPMIILFQKLKRVKKVLGKMNLECFSAISRIGPIGKRRILYKEYRSLLEAEECHFRQKSREDLNVQTPSVEFLRELLQISLPWSANSRQITANENGDKAPGPDGFTSTFFKVAWDIVGADVTKAILYFFQTRKLRPAFNCSSSNGNQVKHYRPISCCSAVYKCVTRIIMNRLTSYLPLIISKNQSAFVQLRNISDNILLAQELVCGYGREFLSLRCAIKVDLQKAFDSLHWVFCLLYWKATSKEQEVLGKGILCGVRQGLRRNYK
ncbi:reverse transcriptase [Gossypium australe]|uniref:Reverse transcriptase n=1 Tax=Gossypium australe TaxID=47621 RepID=A0A5B6W3E4_9ROSI|nr:reverse transcriptase [Gossypium australe]